MSKIQSKVIDQSYRLYSLPKKKGCHLTFFVRKNNIVSIGRNQIFKTHPLAKRFGYYKQNIHSELNALINFSASLSELSKLTVYNVRIDRNGRINNSKPCKHCEKMLLYFGVKRIFYTIKGGFGAL